MVIMLSVKLVVFVVSLFSYGGVYSFMDMDELKSVYYGLDILSEPVVVSKDVPIGVVQVTSKYGQQYQCTFPDHSFEEKRKEEEEKIAFETGIVEMLKPIGLNDCLFKAKDWWSYEFCYGKYIRQFHMEDGEIKGNIIYLGYYQEDFDWNNETTREERLKNRSTLNRYHSQWYTLGTKCDLTGQMRRAEVRFMCEENSEDYLARVDESETCVYTVTVMTSRICRHPYLKGPAKRRPVAITCNPILSEDQYQDYIEEQKEKKNSEAKLPAAARDAPKKEDTAVWKNWEEKLAKALEEDLAAAAKELLGEPLSEFFPLGNKKEMSREEFEKTFGSDEEKWKLYQKGFEIRRKHQELLMKNIAKEEEVSEVKQMGIEDKNAREELDDDDKILSEFDDEIKTMKSKFQSSKNKLTSIRRKLTMERHWESLIENAIKEAEEEIGVKVDRSLISDLSNTLDKLVNKLRDTEKELVSMNKEIGKLKHGQKILRNSKDEEEEEPVGEDKVDDGGGDSGDDEEDENGIGDVDKEEDHKEVEDGVVEVEESAGEFGDSVPDTATQEADAESNFNDLHDKILAPPKLGVKSSHPSYVTGKADDEDEEVADANTQDLETDVKTERPAKAEIEITLKKLDGEEDIDLPKDVQKLLEESVRKEFEKHQQSDSQPLTFDADHSFNREKTVHVIQEEDEEGKTNRYIFVFGFNTFNDESAESERQSTLEDSYGFIYKGKKGKKQQQPPSES